MSESSQEPLYYLGYSYLWILYLSTFYKAKIACTIGLAFSIIRSVIGLDWRCLFLILIFGGCYEKFISLGFCLVFGRGAGSR